MFAVRYYKMWVRRKDDGLTDDKERAQLWTYDEAVAYATKMRADMNADPATAYQHNDPNEPIEVVEVACKQVISRVGLVHETF